MKKNHNYTYLTSYRKKLRSDGTSAEAELWKHIKNKKLDGRKFRRQHSVGNYILDFYCPQEKIGIELDGDDHYWDEGLAKDRIKEEYLKQNGIKIFRVENKWVFHDLDFVLKNIRLLFEK
jgi:very-short-patch-repair endonuclease